MNDNQTAALHQRVAREHHKRGCTLWLEDSERIRATCVCGAVIEGFAFVGDDAEPALTYDDAWRVHLLERFIDAVYSLPRGAVAVVTE